MRSDPDGNFSNNWSTRGNINASTGVAGTRTSPYRYLFPRMIARTSYRAGIRTGYHLGGLGAAPVMEADEGENTVLADAAYPPAVAIPGEAPRAEAEDESGDTPLADEATSSPVSPRAEADDAPRAEERTGSPATVTPEPPVTHPQPPARYIAHFVNGKSQPVNNFVEENGSWLLYDVKGGYVRQAKSLVSYFEPTSEAVGVMRIWTDSAGSHRTTAKFVRIDGQKVILAKADGQTLHVPLEKLSKTDRDLAQRLQELTRSQATGGEP